jgi:hypothetical protein
MSDNGLQIRRVKLMGERLTLRTDISQEEIESMASFAEEKLSKFQISTSPDPKKQTLLAVLHLAGELLEMRQKYHKLSEIQSKSSELTQELLGQLEDI